MNCRKCGSLRITRRRAGFFICQHCGVQPGVAGYDRFGNAPLIQPEIPEAQLELPYEFAAPSRRPLTIYSQPKETTNGN